MDNSSRILGTSSLDTKKELLNQFIEFHKKHEKNMFKFNRSFRKILYVFPKFDFSKITILKIIHILLE